jgi:serine/threonine protein kinase
MQIDNYILEKRLGEGAFGKVLETKLKTDPSKLFATKVYERKKIEGTPHFNYLTNECNILHELNHPNIVKLVDVKKTKNHYYIIMEYCNGGELAGALEKYKEKYGKPFSEELVQYFMRQIIDAFKYIHANNAIHRDIKLENILLHYENKEDKKNFNLMKATVKIIDFGFASKATKMNPKSTIVGNPINMDPAILKKYAGDLEQLKYDQTADIWSLGSICYNMLIGKPVFDPENIIDLIQKVEIGSYKLPINLSKEVVSFLNGMLQYEPKNRLTAEQLFNHQFLRNNIKDFHKIDLTGISGKVSGNQFEVNTKKNRTIWSIFNNEDEEKLMKISPGHLVPISEENGNYISKKKTLNPEKDNIYGSSNDQPIKSSNSYQTGNYPNISNMNSGNYYNPYIVNPFYGPVLPSAENMIPQNKKSQIQVYGNPDYLTNAKPVETNYVFSNSGIFD